MSSTLSVRNEDDPVTDFRSKATLGVAAAAILFMLPVGVYDLIRGETAIGIGSMAVVFILLANAWMAMRGICHQFLTLYGLFPAGMMFMTNIFRMDGIIASFWCYPIVLAAYCMLSERRAWMANLTILIFAMPMVWMTLDNDYALRVTASLGAVSLFAAIMVNVIDGQRQQLQRQLVLDPLTGLLNRLTYNDCMEQAVRLHDRYRQPVSLLAIDIDNFKLLNDTRGHAAGDQVLSMVGHLLRDMLRDEDAIFRMGGEEFTVVLKGANQCAATETAERLRQAVAAADFTGMCRITISIGVAELESEESWESWAKRSDDSLYEAKRRGRNRVVLNEQRKSGERGEAMLAGMS
ncbi:diguanylate cyclase [Granulosicoccus sp. 3-233]|uniref:GGDEF domain-containing protein n=1 Tax=Granulosicoccus sp. 3-233 TaxID=3417969 RepID=UPI003D3420A0